MASAAVSKVVGCVKLPGRMIGVLLPGSRCWYSPASSSGGKGSKSKQEIAKAPVKTIEKVSPKPSAVSKSTPQPGAVTATKSTPPATQEKFDNTTYKSAEYYTYNEWSYYQVEFDMANLRVPQPSAIKKPANS